MLISLLLMFKVQIVMNVQTTKSCVLVLALLCLFKYNNIIMVAEKDTVRGTH